MFCIVSTKIMHWIFRTSQVLTAKNSSIRLGRAKHTSFNLRCPRSTVLPKKSGTSTRISYSCMVCCNNSKSDLSILFNHWALFISSPRSCNNFSVLVIEAANLFGGGKSTLHLARNCFFRQVIIQ